MGRQTWPGDFFFGGERMMPFLKWPGGKRWFTTSYGSFLPVEFNRYIEPFLGGGSVYFHVEPAKAILSDTNEELINTYVAIRNDCQQLKALLRRYQRRHDEEHYYEVRDSSPVSVGNRAARLIYLNRTCFNGIYRVNREGRFNVPKGSRSSVLLHTDDFDAAARLLATADLRTSDFEAVIDIAHQEDFVFADPPYTVSHNNNGFVKYNESLFSWDDQKRLAKTLGRARDRGAIIIATNADHRGVRKLYRDLGFSLRSVVRFSSIASAATSRRDFKELVILGNCSMQCL